MLTPFIDGSQVYGMDNARAAQLRANKSGLLVTSPGLPANPSQSITSRTYLPLSSDVCSQSGNLNCFLAGEFRTSEHNALASIHTLFNREHNRLAGLLGSTKYTTPIITNYIL